MSIVGNRSGKSARANTKNLDQEKRPKSGPKHQASNKATTKRSLTRTPSAWGRVADEALDTASETEAHQNKKVLQKMMVNLSSEVYPEQLMHLATDFEHPKRDLYNRHELKASLQTIRESHHDTKSTLRKAVLKWLQKKQGLDIQSMLDAQESAFKATAKQAWEESIRRSFTQTFRAKMSYCLKTDDNKIPNIDEKYQGIIRKGWILQYRKLLSDKACEHFFIWFIYAGFALMISLSLMIQMLKHKLAISALKGVFTLSCLSGYFFTVAMILFAAHQNKSYHSTLGALHQKRHPKKPGFLSQGLSFCQNFFHKHVKQNRHYQKMDETEKQKKQSTVKPWQSTIHKKTLMPTLTFLVFFTLAEVYLFDWMTTLNYPYLTALMLPLITYAFLSINWVKLINVFYHQTSAFFEHQYLSFMYHTGQHKQVLSGKFSAKKLTKSGFSLKDLCQAKKSDQTDVFDDIALIEAGYGMLRIHEQRPFEGKNFRSRHQVINSMFHMIQIDPNSNKQSYANYSLVYRKKQEIEDALAADLLDATYRDKKLEYLSIQEELSDSEDDNSADETKKSAKKHMKKLWITAMKGMLLGNLSFIEFKQLAQEQLPMLPQRLKQRCQSLINIEPFAKKLMKMPGFTALQAYFFEYDLRYQQSWAELGIHPEAIRSTFFYVKPSDADLPRIGRLLNLPTLFNQYYSETLENKASLSTQQPSRR
jgi:hypothetical protein